MLIFFLFSAITLLPKDLSANWPFSRVLRRGGRCLRLCLTRSPVKKLHHAFGICRDFSSTHTFASPPQHTHREVFCKESATVLCSGRKEGPRLLCSLTIFKYPHEKERSVHDLCKTIFRWL